MNMAKELSNEEAELLMIQHSAWNKKYPFESWFNGNWWHVKKGYDFDIEKKSFRNMIYRKQAQYGRIDTVELENGFLIRRVRNIEGK